jgi:hypothetical protein
MPSSGAVWRILRHPRAASLDKEEPRTQFVRPYEWASNASQPPHHEASHGGIYERFCTGTQPLVVLLILLLWQIQA